jgi:hypothetical protein
VESINSSRYFHVLAAVHCDIIVRHKPRKYTFFKLILQFIFVSNFDVFYMFRTTSVHPQEDCRKHSFCMVSSLAGG